MKTVEIFLLACLKDFKHRVEISNIKSKFEADIFYKLILKYQQIFELQQEFNEIFGAQVTALTCCLATMTTFQVKMRQWLRMELL